MNDFKLKVIYLPIGELTPYKNNAKLHPQEQIDQIKKSINEFGMNDPIAVWGEDNLIVEGHGRLFACQQLGMKEVPVIRLDGLNEEQRRAYTLAHNKLTMNTGFDMEILKTELEAIDLDMGDYGFDDIDLGDIEVDEEIEEDEVPEIPEEPNAKRGDIYRLGDHVLMCGDSTDKKDVKKLMEVNKGDVIDLLMTDPPYNVDYEGGTAEKLSIENDDMDNREFQDFLAKAFGNAERYMREGAGFYVWYASHEVVNFMKALFRVGFRVRQEIIWNKNSFTLGRQDYQWKHEPCLYGWKDGAAHYFVNNRSLATVMDFDKPRRNGEHPTMKPVDLIAHLVGNSTNIGEAVLDLFGGSGTTLIACEILKRRCYMMELDPKYVDVIVERWENITGRKAEKVI